MADKVGTSSSGGEASSKTISVPVFHLYHKLLPGNFNNTFYISKLWSFQWLTHDQEVVTMVMGISILEVWSWQTAFNWKSL